MSRRGIALLTGCVLVPIAVSPGTATISRAGYADSPIEHDAYHGPQFVRAVLEPAGGIYGRVVDESGHPVRSFHLMVRDPGKKTSTLQPSVFESFDGDFAVTNLPGGRFTLEFRCLEGGPGISSPPESAMSKSGRDPFTARSPSC